MREFIKNLLYGKKRKLIHRKFEPKLFLNEEHHEFFVKNGYVHIKNALPIEEVNTLLNFFEQVSHKDTFEKTDYYFNSISFQDVDLRKLIKEKTLEYTTPVLERIIDTKLAVFPLGGGFCINPPHATIGCRPHQDPTTVDETESYAMTVWITLNDMNTENGCMHIIPGSHLWGNIHRSISLQWALNPYLERIWEFMEPVPTKAGDVICFDVSTIHGSTPNKTDRNRLAINIPVFPKSMHMVNYFPIAGNKAEVFHIDENFFLEENQFARPTERYKKMKEVDLDNYYSYDNIRSMVNEFKSEKVAAE